MKSNNKLLLLFFLLFTVFQGFSQLNSIPGGSFRPTPGKQYVLSAWVKEVARDGVQVSTYSNSLIRLFLETVNLEGTSASSSILDTFYPTGTIIDGWQLIEGVFSINIAIESSSEADFSISLENTDSTVNTLSYFDDIRIYPLDGNMKSFVYDPATQRLMAELDENNYATFYEYDQEGGLVRVKKETVDGVFTIQETRSGNSKINSN